MKSLKKNARVILILFLVLFTVLVGYFVYALNTYGNRWLTNPYNVRLQNQKSSVIPGKILDRNSVVLAGVNEEGEREYTSDRTTRKALSHIIGDNYGLTSSGAESFFANYLLGMDTNLFERLAQSFGGQSAQGSSVMLTVDAELTAYASEVLGDYRGAVVVMNYKTGELLVSTSHPMFDPKHMESYLPESQGGTNDAPEGDSTLVNRATAGQYTPGSVFKIITAAAAIRYLPGIESRTFDCTGPLAFDYSSGRYLSSVQISEEEDKQNKEKEQTAATPAPEGEEVVEETDGKNYKWVRDYQSSYHGELTLEKAFAKSCNTTFARIGMELGTQKLAKMAAEFGIGTDFVFKDIILYGSQFIKGNNDYELAWSAVEQYKDLITPLHLCLISAAIANDGQMMEPKLLKGVINSRNYYTAYLKPKVYSKPLTELEAEKMQQLMVSVVEKGTGTNAAISGYTVGGKTGTAEVSNDKSVAANAWFTGFVLDDDHPLAIAVILEKGGSGGGKAAPVAQKILKKAINLGY